jgi:hypothetical protein
MKERMEIEEKVVERQRQRKVKASKEEIEEDLRAFPVNEVCYISGQRIIELLHKALREKGRGRVKEEMKYMIVRDQMKKKNRRGEEENGMQREGEEWRERKD